MQITCTEKQFERSEMKNLEEYHDLYVQSNKLLLADVYENFKEMCLKI